MVTFFLENVVVKRVKEITNLEHQFKDEFVSKNILSCKTARYIFILFSDMVLMYIFLLFSRYVELRKCRKCRKDVQKRNEIGYEFIKSHLSVP